MMPTPRADARPSRDRPRRPLALALALALLAPILTGPTPVAATQTDALAWTQVASGERAPGPRWDHTLAADESGGRLVLVGGRDGAGTPLGDTWLLDLADQTWEQAAPGPAPRFGHAVAVDEAARILYLFAGQADGATFFDDTWRLDLDSLTWDEIDTGAGPRPSARYGTSAVLDGAGHLLVSHGFTFDGRFDDTWSLDLATGAWTDVSPAPETRPLKRCLHEAVWDADAQRMLLFGGCSSGVGPCPQGDLWAFDPAASAWTELTPATGPAPRSNPALALDPANTRALLFAGLTAEGYAADLWSLPLGDPDAAWHQLTVTGDQPAARASHDAVVAADRLYLFGGFGGPTGSDALADLWTLTIPAA